MDISKLELFFAAANNESFTKAAKECNVAQTTMSKYIAQLEDELGVQLFYRTTRECFLTEAGHIFYSGARELLNDYYSIEKQVQNVNDNELTIGIYGEFFDLSILRRFKKDHPEIELKVIFDDRINFSDLLNRRKIHAYLVPDILVTNDSRNPSFRSVNVAAGEANLYCTKEVMERYGTIENVVRNLPYLTKASVHEYHDSCRNLFLDNYGYTFKEIIVTESRAKQQLLLNLSQGFAIIVESELDDPDNLTCHPLNGLFDETLQLIYSIKNMPSSLKTFIDYINASYSISGGVSSEEI